MTEFPTILYRTPGRHQQPRGATYDYKAATDQETFDGLITKGWSPSYEDAVAATAKAVEKPIDEVSAPTRQELESKASELGVSYDGRTSDKKLAERIAEALEG
jgi:creatinine amidohydrolase/Fe(II)-dependent formamide hydrolase-like protein